MTSELLQAIGFTAPMICTLACLLLTAADVCRQTTTQGRTLRVWLILAYFTGAMFWTGLLLCIINKMAFTWYFPFFLCALMMEQVLIYCFVHYITAINSKRQLSVWHYLVPSVITMTAFVLSFMIPIEQKQDIIYGTTNADSHGWFSLPHLTSIIFIVYNTLYPHLGLIHVRRFRRQADDYFSDPERTSLSWISTMHVLKLITVSVPLIGLLIEVNSFNIVYFTAIGALPTFFFYVILCYNLISENYVTIEPETEIHHPPHEVKQISRARFEDYMRRRKPYTNPNLRITNVAADLNSNRTYISTFINHEYGMNFNRLVNSYRLRELDRLRVSATSAGLSNFELILLAGFNSYRSYLRTKKNEDSRRTVPQF